MKSDDQLAIEYARNYYSEAEINDCEADEMITGFKAGRASVDRQAIFQGGWKAGVQRTLWINRAGANVISWAGGEEAPTLDRAFEAYEAEAKEKDDEFAK